MICLGVLYLFIPLVVTEFLESENWHISFVLETFSHYLFIYCSASLSLSYPSGIPISYVRSISVECLGCIADLTALDVGTLASIQLTNPSSCSLRGLMGSHSMEKQLNMWPKIQGDPKADI